MRPIGTRTGFKLIVIPMPEATTRLAALRSGQVDWIEVPPPDAIPSLKAAGFQISLWPYPHIWPYIFNVAEGSAFRDIMETGQVSTRGRASL